MSLSPLNSSGRIFARLPPISATLGPAPLPRIGSRPAGTSQAAEQSSEQWRAGADAQAAFEQRLAAAIRASSPIDSAAQVQQTIHKLASTPTGSDLINRIHADGTVVAVAPVSGFEGGTYNAGLNMIHLTPGVAADPSRAALVLAHEAQHHVDARQGRPGPSLANEASAYVVQAQVAGELGVPDFGAGTSPDGRRRSFPETVQAVAQDPRYSGLPAFVAP